ncbi:hypothetical protein D9M68_996380 [compost metagenome]
MDTDVVALGAVPGEIEAHGPFFARTDAVLPVIGRNEVAAGVAHDRHVGLTNEVNDVLAHTVLVGSRMIRLIDTRIDGAAEMFDEGSVKTRIN